MRIKRFSENKKEKESEEVKFDIKSFEPKEDDLIGFESDSKEIPEGEIEKIKKDITDIKKFEDFTVTLSTDSCKCCDDCTGEYDCECGCVDCKFEQPDEICDICNISTHECPCRMDPSDEMKYHLANSLPVTENVFRPGSKKFFALLKEARNLYDSGLLELKGIDKELYESTEIGKFAMFRGEMVALDIPMEYIEEMNEAEYHGKEVKLNHPMRNTGSGKKYYVYVRNPKTGKVKKISFGDVHGGLSAKISDPEARKSFAARHKCSTKKDKTKAGYFACRLTKYGHLFGGKTYPGYW